MEGDVDSIEMNNGDRKVSDLPLLHGMESNDKARAQGGEEDLGQEQSSPQQQGCLQLLPYKE
jgi:hypothetical protein